MFFFIKYVAKRKHKSWEGNFTRFNLITHTQYPDRIKAIELNRKELWSYSINGLWYELYERDSGGEIGMFWEN